jgi:hypothetical protein
VVLLPSFALPGFASNYAIGIWGVCWLLLGRALRAEYRDGGVVAHLQRGPVFLAE